MMQTPLPVVFGQVGVGGVRCEQVVESACGGVEGATVEVREGLAQPSRQSDEARDVALAEVRG
jgi:hypothetical protein